MRPSQISAQFALVMLARHSTAVSYLKAPDRTRKPLADTALACDRNDYSTTDCASLSAAPNAMAGCAQLPAMAVNAINRLGVFNQRPGVVVANGRKYQVKSGGV